MRKIERIEAKLDRAHIHYRDLDDSIQRFLERDPYAIVGEQDSRTNERIYRLQIKERPPIMEWGGIVGDYLYNLRSSLDHMVYILAGDPPPKPGATEFPIYTAAAKYAECAPQKLVGVPEEAQKIIESVQPYHRGDDSPGALQTPLWTLHDFNNIDKHRYIRVFGGMVGYLVYREPLVYESTFEIVPFEDGKELARFSLAGDESDYDDPDFTFDIAFGEGSLEGLIARPWLRRMETFIRRAVLPPFAGWLA